MMMAFHSAMINWQVALKHGGGGIDPKTVACVRGLFKKNTLVQRGVKLMQRPLRM
jgi:hypothetical protein